jgi:predicted ATPase with chaperone activity
MKSLETLRQPLENRIVAISRARGSPTSPGSFMLVPAMVLFPSGFDGKPAKLVFPKRTTIDAANLFHHMLGTASSSAARGKP